MLVLADTNSLGLDLDQLCQRILQSPAYGDSTTHRGILIWKLAPALLKPGCNSESIRFFLARGLRDVPRPDGLRGRARRTRHGASAWCRWPTCWTASTPDACRARRWWPARSPWKPRGWADGWRSLRPAEQPVAGPRGPDHGTSEAIAELA